MDNTLIGNKSVGQSQWTEARSCG